MLLPFLMASFLVVNLDDGGVREVPSLTAAELRPSAATLVLRRLPGEDALYAGVYEVTQGQWQKVMGENPSFFSAPERRESRPVECVSYDRALVFLGRLSRKTGFAFSLPTTNEWAYACRAGTTGKFYADAPLGELARYWENGGRGAAKTSGPDRGTAVVGSYRPNAWGLYDMLGNVREWCLGDPNCGTRKWTRGGAWALPEKKCTVDAEYFPDRTSDAPTSGLRVFSHGRRLPATDVPKRELWARFMDPPADYVFTNEVKLVQKFDWPECDGELYLQRNGPRTFQRVLFTFPKGMKGKVPGLVVPYYTPEGMIARRFATGADIKGQLRVAMMRFAAERGWAAACGDTFQENYMPELGIKDFRRWRIIAEEFNRDWPTWNCMGKKVFDIKLMTDLFAADARVDADKLGIVGHSLGGQSAFYCGFLDPRFKVVAASDFGVRFDQTFWESPWYWGEKLREARDLGLDNTDLVRFGNGKPLCVISGKTDDETSGEVIRATGAYDGHADDFLFLNHQTGHRPPPEVLKRAFDFLERTLGKGCVEEASAPHQVDDLARLENLIRIPSVSSNVVEVNRAVAFLKREFERDGLTCFVETNEEGRDILYACNDGSKTPDVLFSAHLDVVPAQTPELFNPKRRDGRIYGRGASDCKTHCILSGRLMRELKGKVSCGCIFGSDEEVGGSSTAFMVKRGYVPKKLVIVIDSEQYMVTTRQKGLATYNIRATEKPTHTGFVKGKIPNAVRRLANAYEAIAAEVGEFEDGSWRDCVSLGKLEGTRTEATMSISVRCAYKGGWERIERIIREKIGEATMENTRKSEPVCLDESDPVLNDFLARMKAKWPDRDCSFYHLNSTTDARHLQYFGLPMLILCTDARGAHTADEHLNIFSFFEYDELIRSFLEEKYKQGAKQNEGLHR